MKFNREIRQIRERQPPHLKSDFVSSLDRKLATALKAALKNHQTGSGAHSHSEFHEILKERIASEDLRSTLQTLFSNVVFETDETAYPEVVEASRLMRILVERGFSETSAVAFLAWLDLFGGLSVDEVLDIAPNTVCFDRWLDGSKASAQEIRQHLAKHPDKAYATIGADWLLEDPKPEFSFSIVEKFLSRHRRPEYLLSWNEGLAAAMKKDKRGELLATILRQPSITQDQVHALSEAIRPNRVLFKAVVELLPTILGCKDSTATAVHFVQCLFDDVVISEEGEREFFTAALGRLGAGIVLADRRSPHLDEVLVLVRKITRQLRNLTKGETAQAQTWVFENLSEEEKPGDGKLCVNLQGARYIALAFEKADQGFAAKDVLTMTARNLGLSPIGKKGETVSYDPLRHEDIEGGLLPGATVLIEQEGWAIVAETVARAKVRKAKGGKYV